MSTSNQHLDPLFQQILSTTNATTQNQLLKTAVRDEGVLGLFLSDGQDPLSLLNTRVYTPAMLHILSVRLHANFSTTPAPLWHVVQHFCQNFDPKHAQMAPERVTRVAKGIYRMASAGGNLSMAIPCLYDLVIRFPPNLSYLTPLHPIFVLACVATRNPSSALPVITNPITEISTSLCPDLTYTDNLSYHYTSGIALASLKMYPLALTHLEICVTSPGVVPAALQMEALKKLRLVQLIALGGSVGANSGSGGGGSGGGGGGGVPKYAHPQLGRLWKGTVYAAFVGAFPRVQAMREVLEKEKAIFIQENNLGLAQQAIARAPRWALKKLTATYVTLHLSDIGRAVKISDESEVRNLLLSMIEDNDITAQISASGTVTFSDPPPQYTKAQVDDVLRKAQEQSDLLAFLEAEMGRSREFLNKVVKSSDSSWAPTADEEIFSNLGGQHMWEESVYS